MKELELLKDMIESWKEDIEKAKYTIEYNQMKLKYADDEERIEREKNIAKQQGIIEVLNCKISLIETQIFHK